MSISAIPLAYHTGLPITHAGSVMQRISLHLPLERVQRDLFEKAGVWGLHPWKFWWTHGVTMLCLFKLPGTSSCMVRGDTLHILFCKGLCSHLMGGILHYLCHYEGPGVRTAKKPTERLSVLFSQVQVHYTQQQCKNRLTNLRLSTICDPSKPWSKHPVLDRKGGESRHLLPALTPVLQSVFAGTTETCEVEMLNVCHTPAEYEEILSLGGSFLKSYAWLNAWSLEKDRMSFHVVVKHHSFSHLLWNSRHLNPKLQWCFQGGWLCRSSQ